MIETLQVSIWSSGQVIHLQRNLHWSPLIVTLTMWDHWGKNLTVRFWWPCWRETKGKLATNDETVPNKHFNPTRGIPWVLIRRITLCITLPQRCSNHVLIPKSEWDCDETWQSCADSGLMVWPRAAQLAVFVSKCREKWLAGWRGQHRSWTGLGWLIMESESNVLKLEEENGKWTWNAGSFP